MSRPMGFSLVELIIALLLGILLTAGAGKVFLSTNKTYTLQDQLIRMQENARTALELLVKDIRMSGYTGCPVSANLGNALQAKEQGRLWMTHFDKGLMGIPSGNRVKSEIDPYALSEAVIVHRVDWQNSFSVLHQNTETATLYLSALHRFNQGDLLALVGQNCKQISVFIAGFDTKDARVTYPVENSRLLSNCTGLNKGDFNCISKQKESNIFDHTGSQLVPISTTAYYVRESAGVPVLYRKRAGEMVSGSTLAAEALVEGIENMRVLYGYDTDNDGVVNQYLPPIDMMPYSDDWKKILSIKVELLVRSLRETAAEPDPYFFAGKKVIPKNHYIRRVVVATVDLRNRGY
ncbi:MAG: PilW family protein [Endozoicomonas sp. (ex Botrylloides leachii)]|nr:PilW family protein [Endozoicomonas sp. (ex Botrylloides leachii)]